MEEATTNLHHPARLSRLAAALAGFGVAAAAAWTLASGFPDLPAEIFTPRQQVELSIPYRGFCHGLSISENGSEVVLTYRDIKAGLARFAMPLGPGRHELEVRFDTIIPGMQRSYPLVVVVDLLPPALSFDKIALLSEPVSSTVEPSLTLKGRTDEGARLYVDDKEQPVSTTGAFAQELPLKEGWNHLLVRAEDRAGNRTAKRFSIFRDVAIPEVTWHTAPGQSFKEPSARLDLSVTDDGPLAAVAGKVDGKAIVWHRKPDDRWLGVTEELAEGRHQVELKVADKAGRVVLSKREILIDSSETLGEAEIMLGARGEDVVQLHQRLLDAGYLKSDPGSTFTAATKQALELLQADEGYTITGMADHQTLIALGPRIFVNLSQFSLVLERPGQPDRRWTIACGAPEFPTPTGRFVIYEKVQDPTWLPPNSDWAKDATPVEPGPNNPLGTRWIGLDWGGVGIHGTNMPWTVGSAASHGCLRMEISQVEELFSLVEVGTPVVILDGSQADPVLEKFWPKG